MDFVVNVKKCRNQKLVHHWQDGKLRCSTCKMYHDPSCFDSNTSKAHRDYKDGVCKSCKSMAAKNRKMQKYTADPLRRMLVERVAGAKDRCKRSNVFIDITLDDLFYLWDRQDGKCAISRIPMTYTMGEGRTPTNVSIDQIEPSKGYTLQNIQLVCMAVNQIKSDMSMEELLTFCKAIAMNARSWNKGD